MSHSKKLQFILNKLYELNPDKIELKLDRVFRLANDLRNPQRKLKNVITVTGTNAKGGTAFYIKDILLAHGYSVALFQSPFLYNFLTRFLINNKPLDEEKFIQYVIETDKANNNQDITFFEYSKKNSRVDAPAVVGIQLKIATDFEPLLSRMKEHGFFGDYLNEKPDLFQYLV